MFDSELTLPSSPPGGIRPYFFFFFGGGGEGGGRLSLKTLSPLHQIFYPDQTHDFLVRFVCLGKMYILFQTFTTFQTKSALNNTPKAGTYHIPPRP